MAPTKRKSNGNTDNHTVTRVTRSSTRQNPQSKPIVEPAPKPKKAKITSKPKPELKPKTTEAPPPPSDGGNDSKTIVIEHWYGYCHFLRVNFTPFLLLCSCSKSDT